MLWYKISVIFLFLLLCHVSHAQLQIAEIYPAPAGGEYEWIELVNSSTNPELLSLYTLTDATGKKISLPDTILSGNEILIATSSSILNNADETITLAKGAEVIESISYSSTFDFNKAFVRCGNNWIVTNLITKGTLNTSACLVLTPTATPTLPAAISAVPTTSNTASISSSDFDLNEFYPYPNTGEVEWVEFYNRQAETIILDNWYIDDVKDGGSRPFQFTLEIPGLSYALLELPTSILNNTSDTIRLLNQTQEEVFSYTYTSGKKGYSFGKTDMMYCMQVATKRTINTPCVTIEAPRVTPTSFTQSSSQPAAVRSPLSKAVSENLPSYLSLPKLASQKGHDYILHVVPYTIPSYSLFAIRFAAVTAIILSMTVLSLLIVRFKVRYTVL